MRPRAPWIIALLLCLFIALSAPPAAAQGEAPLSFSVERVQMKGVIGKDIFAASFHLLSGAQEVQGIKLLPSDLVNERGKVIAASQYQVSPTTISALPAHSGELVTVSVNNVPASGVYTGTLSVLFTGRDPQQRLELGIRLEAFSQTDLELATGSSLVSIHATRALPWGRKLTAPASFSLRQKADATATIAQVTLIDPPDSLADAEPLPLDAVVVKPVPPLSVAPQKWQTFEVQVDTARLAAGHYAGTLVITPQDGDDRQVTLDVQLRDNWLGPVITLLAGVFFSLLIAYMATTGSARMQALREIDGVRAMQASKAGLGADSLADWRERLARLEEEAKRRDLAAAQAGINAIKAEMAQAQETTGKWLKQLEDWQAELERRKAWADRDELLGALMQSPLVGRLQDDMAALGRTINAGDFTPAQVEGQLEVLSSDMARLNALSAALPKVHTSDDEQIVNQRDQFKDILAGATGFAEGKLAQLIGLLKAKALLEDVQPPAIAHYAAEAAPPAPPEKGVLARARDWLREPRHYLPLLNGLLRLLFLVLLLAAGLQALYIGKPTFGANRFGDYLGLLLWGIGADASRKQLKDLEDATGFLRQRLGVPPEPPQ